MPSTRTPCTPAPLAPARLGLALALLGLAFASAAQPPGPRAPRSPRAAAQVDLTGQWVAQITEDWRWRMITPPKGDYASVPLNPAGRQIADQWDLARDNAAGEQCRAFGAGGIMRQPTRLRIAWADDSTLEVDTDAGEQKRVFHFDRAAPADGAPTWQGHSVAAWTAVPPANPFGFLVPPTQEASAARGGGGPPGSSASPAAGAAPARSGAPPSAPAAPARGSAPPPRASGAPSGAAGPPAGAAGPPPGFGAPPPLRGSLKVVTTQLRPGYLRKNGVPYSDRAVVTEYYDRLSMFGNEYLQVVTVVTDPAYLTTPFVVSNQFKREADGSKWNPTPCATDPPVATFHPPATGQ